MDTYELPLWYINAIIDDSINEVHIPAIVDKIMGEINVVIDY